MSTVELEIRRNQLVRKILNERDINIILSMEDYFRKTKRTTTHNREKQKLVKDFLLFADNNSITVPNFTFNREECYVR